jgi:hypothetical protein
VELRCTLFEKGGRALLLVFGSGAEAKVRCLEQQALVLSWCSGFGVQREDAAATLSANSPLRMWLAAFGVPDGQLDIREAGQVAPGEEQGLPSRIEPSLAFKLPMLGQHRCPAVASTANVGAPGAVLWFA